ncbi:MAG: hypothetical protein AB7E29_11110 [Xanthobacter sp.]
MTTELTGADAPIRCKDTASSPHMPHLGIIPRSTAGRFFLGWAILNVLLTLMPVFGVFGNGNEIVDGILPLTVLYSYCIFTLNCVFGLVYFFSRGRSWAATHAVHESREKAEGSVGGAR